MSETHRVFQRSLVVILFILAAGSAQGAKWDPLPAEMADIVDCPTEPGCNAIVLRHDLIWDNEFSDTRLWHHLMIKILKTDGLDAASVKIRKVVGSWNVRDIEGRTIQSDGTVVNLDPNSAVEETVHKQRGYRGKTISFQMPGAEVGAILEYRYKYIYHGHLGMFTWALQSRFPTLSASMSIAGNWAGSPKPVNLDRVRMKSEKDTKSGNYIVSIRNIPSMEEEPFMPPDDESRGRIVFYPTQPWWSLRAVRRGYDAALKKYYSRSSKAKKLARQVLGEAADPEEKIARIYAYIQEEVDNSSFRETSEGEVVEGKNLYVDDVIVSGQGTTGQLARLFVFMARQAGLEAEMALVARRNDSFYRPEVMYYTDFDAELATLIVDGERRWFDPGTPYCPQGMVSWEKEGLTGNALLPGPSGSSHRMGQVMPSRADDNTKERKTHIELTADGAMVAEVENIYRGLVAVEVRNDVDHATVEERHHDLEEALQDSFPGATLEEMEYLDLDAWREPLTLRYRFRVDEFGTAAGSRLLVPVVLFPKSNPFTAEKRHHPIYFPRTSNEVDEVTIRVPEGYEIESLPHGRTVDLTALMYRMRIESEDQRGILVRRTMKTDILLVEAKQYTAVKNLYEEAARVDGSQIVLRRSTGDGETAEDSP